MAGFEVFWTAYPRKVGKGAARKVWAKLQPSDALVTQMLETLAWQRATWTDPRYIPHPTTWLNQERWTDEPPQMVTLSKRTETSFRGLREFLNDEG